MFQSILIILRELLYINKVYINIDGLLNTLKFVHKNVCRYHNILFQQCRSGPKDGEVAVL